MVDGTFKTTPKISKQAQLQIPYDQIWIISAIFIPDDPLKWTMEALPCIYVLKPGRKASEKTYTQVLRFIVKKAKDVGVDLKKCDWDVMMDFERGERKAFEAEFPKCVVHGCGFHYCKALFKNLGDHGLTKVYRSNTNFRYHIRKYMMLMLMPSHMVQKAWNELKTHAAKTVPKTYQTQFANWLKYHKKIWMDGTYNIDEWNMWKAKLRTNNLAEIFNCRLSQVLGSHPSLVDWITEIQKQLALTVARWKQLLAFGKTHYKANAERKKDESIRLLSERLEKNEIASDQFLELCSKAMKFHFNSVGDELGVNMDDWIQDKIDDFV